MTFLSDLAPFTYSNDKEDPEAFAVGWLCSHHSFVKGETTTVFRSALNRLCNDRAMQFYRGHHVCEFCAGATFGDEYFRRMGNGEIRVLGTNGTWYIAPRLVSHYVEAHNYLPPQQFIDAVISPIEIDSDNKKIKRRQALEEKRLSAPPVTQAEIDKLVQQGIEDTKPRKPWWKFS